MQLRYSMMSRDPRMHASMLCLVRPRLEWIKKSIKGPLFYVLVSHPSLGASPEGDFKNEFIGILGFSMGPKNSFLVYRISFGR